MVGIGEIAQGSSETESCRNSFRVANKEMGTLIPQGYKANTSSPCGLRPPRPGLELANAFSVTFADACCLLFLVLPTDRFFRPNPLHLSFHPTGGGRHGVSIIGEMRVR
jgi:hypothetical protein